MTYLFEACNEVKQFTTCSVLQDHEDLALGVDELKQLDGVRIVESSKNFELSLNFLEDTELADLLFVQYFYGDFVTRLLMICHYRIDSVRYGLI